MRQRHWEKLDIAKCGCGTPDPTSHRGGTVRDLLGSSVAERTQNWATQQSRAT